MVVVLASGSPRRRLLMTYLLDKFEVEAPDVDESVAESMAPADAVVEVAKRKAKAASVRRPGDLCLGADTGLDLEGVLLGKPEDRDHLRMMLQAMEDRSHNVVTGLAVAKDGNVLAHDGVTSKVRLDPLPVPLFEAYAGSDVWHGKAGGYGIQDPYLQEHLRLSGSWSNVVGLPLQEAAALLEGQGVTCKRFPDEAALQADNPF